MRGDNNKTIEFVGSRPQGFFHTCFKVSGRAIQELEGSGQPTGWQSNQPCLEHWASMAEKRENQEVIRAIRLHKAPQSIKSCHPSSTCLHISPRLLYTLILPSGSLFSLRSLTSFLSALLIHFHLCFILCLFLVVMSFPFSPFLFPWG